MPDTATALVEQALAGDRRAIAKVLSLVEQGGEGARTALGLLHAHTGNAWSIGITGAPGAGKSTLTDELVVRLRRDGSEVGVLAVDPTSPFSGGAILGDRVRMQHHTTDDGVFIRSMATRGHLGGLALATPQAVRVLDAVGKAWIVIETVGVGQVEVEIAGHADTTVVVVNPGWGDAVQTAKAGLMEIADVFVVNKADRPGAAETVRDLRGMLELSGALAWRPPIVETTATTGDGVDALYDAIVAHRSHLEASGEGTTRRRARLREELRGLVAARMQARADAACTGERFEAAVEAVATRAEDPYAAADALLDG
jgi:GTPase